MSREAGERGATATIVSSDKDLMQLVTDKVTMYDTMKDRRIGIAEVIEKFGVPPEKVVEVQALAGDSTDNVPGVPGIGIKTAAQLIVEYGDLETLLARAGEIKQPKRREALIENAEKARISRQLVLLDDKVKLDVPLDELAVHEPDARKLIAFLKAMEFSTLTRRVAEYSQIDPSDVEADDKNSSGASGKSAGSSPPPPRAAGGDLFGHQDAPARLLPPAARRARPASARPGQGRNNPNVILTPQALAAARAEAARKTPVDRSKYSDRPHASPNSTAGSRGRTMLGHFAIEAKANSIDPMQAEMSRHRAGAGAERRLLCPARPQAVRRRLRPVRGRSRARPDQGRPTRSRRCGRCWNRRGILKIGFNIKFNAVMLAQHGITLRNHDDAQLMSYALDAGRNSHALDALAESWLGHAMISHGELTGSGKAKLCFDQVAIDRATAYSAEDADVILRLWSVLKPRLVAERMTAVYETLERPLISVLARMERRGISIDRQVLSRLSADFAQTAARVESEIQEIAGRAGQCRQPEADRRYPVRQDGPSRRHQDQDRRVVDHGASARRARRTGP